MKVKKLIAKTPDNKTEFWRINDDVYRVALPTALDIYDLPTARRWECTVDHWNRFRAIYDWAPDVA